MAQIEAIKKQYYRITVWLPRSPEGKRNYEREYFKGSREDAKKRGRELEEEVKSGVVQRSRSMTVDQYLDQWLRLAVQPKVAPRTLHDYTSLLKRYVRDHIGALKLSDLEPLHIQHIYSRMREAKLSPRTIRYTHTVLHAALKQAVRWRQIRSNAAEGAELPQSARRNISALTEQELARFATAAKTSEHYCLFLLAATTGLRPEEYLALEWSAIDFDAHRVKVSRALIWERQGKGWSFGPTKTKKGERTVPITAAAAEALRAHQREQTKMRMKAGKWPELNLVFCTSRGGPIDPGNLGTRSLKPVLDKAGLPDTLNLYTMRHTAITLWLAAGVSPKTVSEWAGHASVSFTLDTYAHMIPSMERAGAAQIEAMFGGILASKPSGGTHLSPKKQRKPPAND